MCIGDKFTGSFPPTFHFAIDPNLAILLSNLVSNLAKVGVNTRFELLYICVLNI